MMSIKERQWNKIPFDWENQERISAASWWNFWMESWPPHWFCTAIWRPFHRERCSVIPSFRRESVSVFTFWRVTRLVPLAVSIVNIEDSAAYGLCFCSCLFVECHVDKGERRPAEKGEQRGIDYFSFSFFVFLVLSFLIMHAKNLG